MSYTLLQNGLIQHGDSLIPPDLGNVDYQAYLAWVAEGNTTLIEQPSTVSQAHNYFGFYQGLLGEDLPLFLFVRSLADSNLPVSNAYTDLMGAIQFQQLPGFQSSIWVLLGAMQGASQPFSVAQTAAMRSLLDRYGFADVALF